MNAQLRLLSVIDRSRLFGIGDTQWLSAKYPSAQVRELNRLLKRARFVDAPEVPPDVVTMNSRVRLIVEGEAESRELTLVFPEDMGQFEGGLSILTPMAQALLGAHCGDVITWEAPAGTMSARVEKLLFQPEAALYSS